MCSLSIRNRKVLILGDVLVITVLIESSTDNPVFLRLDALGNNKVHVLSYLSAIAFNVGNSSVPSPVPTKDQSSADSSQSLTTLILNPQCAYK
uniref:Uncharacterized protein n=1 Tax=Candidatus Methanogaster sp. ANME-2c ERB4 TaxID=2759911 RepID=A0A7G9Y1X6_9EURY|nr:hypothetical protein BELEBKFC_00001 [Methanosarcinales archaeon ANME-2c ERB4]